MKCNDVFVYLPTRSAAVEGALFRSRRFPRHVFKRHIAQTSSFHLHCPNSVLCNGIAAFNWILNVFFPLFPRPLPRAHTQSGKTGWFTRLTDYLHSLTSYIISLPLLRYDVEEQFVVHVAIVSGSRNRLIAMATGNASPPSLCVRSGVRTD